MPSPRDVEIVDGSDPTVLPECLRVITAAFHTVADEFGLTKENARTNAAFWTLGDLKAELARGGRLLAARTPEGVRGCVIVRPSTRPDVYYLERLAVLPEVRRHGYGRVLVEAAVAAAAGAGAGTVSIGIIAENRGLERWYRNLGFVITGEQTFPHLPFTVRYLQRDTRTDSDPNG